MIRIEDFLFLENVEQSQAESLISTYRNLSFETSQEFRDYFQLQGVRLVIKQNQEALVAFDDTQVLLERLKNFKSSTDYDYVKKYIIREKTIEEAVQVGKIELAKNEFDSLTKEELDPFFGFIVRKMLTGNENGVLPSENLKAILDEQNRINTQVNMDMTVPVERDSTGKIISFKNYLKNRGFVSFDTTTERYAPRSFDYIIDKSFTSIPEAVDAERYVLEKAEEWATDINVSADEAVFLEKLRKLINEDSTSIPALESKIEKLQLQLSEAEEAQQNMNDTNDNLLEAIEQLSVEFNQKVSESEAKDSQIVSLNQTIDSTLTDLGTSVTAQIENAADAFDALSSKLEEQAKKAEEQAKSQLDAFTSGITAIADAIKTGSSKTETSGSGGSNTSGGGTTNGTSGTSGKSSSGDTIPPIKEKRIRQQIEDAINRPTVSLETLELIALDLGITVTLPDFVLPKSSNSQRDKELTNNYVNLVTSAKSAIKSAVNKIPFDDDVLLTTVWTDLKEAGLIVEESTTSSSSGNSGTSGRSTSGTSGRGGGGTGTGIRTL